MVPYQGDVETIACKQLGCLGRVQYVAARIPDVFRGLAAFRPAPPRRIRVYLTCDNPGEQHEYPYEVIANAESPENRDGRERKQRGARDVER